MPNKIALITGGSRGLGKNMALRLAQQGRSVIITYQSQKELADEVVSTIEEQGQKAAAIQYDSADFNSLDSFLQHLRQTLQSKFSADKFDFLINNAGVGATIPFLEATEKDFDRFMNIHLKSVYFLTQRSLALMND